MRIRIEILLEWLVTAVMVTTEVDADIVTVVSTQKLNWWGVVLRYDSSPPLVTLRKFYTVHFKSIRFSRHQSLDKI